MLPIRMTGYTVLPKRSFDVRNIAARIVFAALLMVTTGCTVTHEFGPFMGKVVDVETGEPIEGAVVLIGFHTKSGSVGGTVYRFADAIETLTDAKGEFRLPPKRVNLFRGMSIWDDDCQVSIFKPGFGAYPGHRQAQSSWEHKHARIIPENEYVTYYLPRLLTLEERKENLHNIETPGGIPIQKMPDLRRLEDEEYANVGID